MFIVTTLIKRDSSVRKSDLVLMIKMLEGIEPGGWILWQSWSSCV
jgi:hypothetical protein